MIAIAAGILLALVALYVCAFLLGQLLALIHIIFNPRR